MRSTLLLLLAAPAFAAVPTSDIRVDQVGYPPQAPKIALVTSKAAGTEYTVGGVQNGEIAWKGKLGASVDDPEEAYSANEVAINWNAPLVFLLAGALPAK